MSAPKWIQATPQDFADRVMEDAAKPLEEFLLSSFLDLDGAPISNPMILRIIELLATNEFVYVVGAPHLKFIDRDFLMAKLRRALKL